MSTINNLSLQHTRDTLFEFLSRKRVLVALTIVPALALFTFVSLIPILWALWASLYEIPIFAPEWTFTGLSNYIEVLQNPELWSSLYRSLIFAGGSVALQLVVGVALALLVNRSFKLVGLVRAIVMLPYLIPTAIVGFLALWMGNAQFGIINSTLIQMGLIDNPISWYGNLDLAMISVIVANSWKFSIFVTIMVLARLQSIPEGYYEAAQMAGASAYQRFRDVTLPNLKGVIFIVLLLRGVWMFNKFDIIYVLTQGGPGSATRTAPIFAYELAFNIGSLGASAAASVILFLMLVVTAVVYFRTLSPEEEVRVE